MSSSSRFGKLRKVFKGGESELYNAVARLTVFYEDFRLEMGEFRAIHASLVDSEEAAMEYRTMYYLRRSLSTLVEFRGALTAVRRTSEFKLKEASLTAMDAGHILRADRYLQQNWEQIKKLRNGFGGHLELDAVKFALCNWDSVGKVTWNRSSDGWTMGLECHFATDVLAGAISSKFRTDTDIRAEWGKAMKIIAYGFIHAQAATLALVHAFLWDRFGA